MERRRRTDRLPLPSQLPADAVERARAACEHVVAAGFAASCAVVVPDDGGQGLVSGAAGRVEHLVDIARGSARSVARDGRALRMVDVDSPRARSRERHAAMPVGRCGSATVVLVVSDPRLSRREAQACAAWIAPARAGTATTQGGACGDLVRRVARRHHADVVVLALFAASGMRVNVHVRNGALLHSARVPTDTVWGEVARHGAAFTLGDLSLHPGTGMLGALGMSAAALVGLENGAGIAIGALGIASADELDVDAAHHLLADAPRLGPAIMEQLSSTAVPVPAEDGTVDLGVLAARVGCRRFAAYELLGTELRLVAAHARDGAAIDARPDELETQLVTWAVQKGVGVVGDDAAAVLIGNHTVLYAQDPAKRALDCLRLALHDIRRNPFGAEEPSSDERAA